MTKTGPAAIRFGFAGIWSVLILFTIPYGPRITGAISEAINSAFHTDKGPDCIAWSVAAIISLALVLMMIRLLRLPALRSPLNIAIITVVAVTYIRIYTLMDNPPEKIHFLEYGILAWLLHRAWRPVYGSRVIVGLVILPAWILGVIDEWIQHLTRGRYGDFMDVCWNLSSVALPVIVLMIFAPSGDAPPKRSEIRLVRAMATAFLSLIAAFLILTQEFGVLIEDPRGYSFRSRSGSPEELVAGDTVPSRRLAEELRLQGPFNYDTFQLHHPIATDARVNEFRVHLFRRDRYLGGFVHAMTRRTLAGVDSAPSPGVEGDRALRRRILDYDAAWLLENHSIAIRSDPGWEREIAAWIGGETLAWGGELTARYLAMHDSNIRSGDIPERDDALNDLRIAERENRILEDYFGLLLTGAGLQWSETFQGEIGHWMAEVRAPTLYESAVAKRVLTGYTPGGILGMTALAILAVILWPTGSDSRAHRARRLLILLIAIDVGALALSPRLHPPSLPALATIQRTTVAAVPNLDPHNPSWLELRDAATGERVTDTAVVSFTFNRDALRVGFRCIDTRIIATITERDSDLWREDAFELFIDTEGWGRKYIELEVNALGTIYDAHVAYARAIDFSASKSVTLDSLRVEADTTSDGWRIDLEIPWTTLGLEQAPAALRINACRIDANGTHHSYLSWSPTRGWFHRPSRFGLLIAPGADRI